MRPYMSPKTRVHIFVSGLVQGVFFRAETKARAKELVLFGWSMNKCSSPPFAPLGWVRNLEDGRVEILAEGEKEKLEKLVEWAKRGPEAAKVDGIDVVWQEYKNEFKDFKIR